MDRRKFLQSALGGTAVLGSTGAGILFGSCEQQQSQANTEFIPDVELVLTAAPDQVVLRPGRATPVWRFKGQLTKGPPETLQTLADSYLGPVIRFRRGQKVRVRFSNKLPEPSIVHWHGLDVPEKSDGHPRLAVGAGQEYVYEFEVTNRAGTYWYHPHPHMRTGAQVYQGLAGMIIVRDDEEDALALPSGEHEHVCVLQDRKFDGQNQLVFHGGSMMEMMNGFLGDQVMVSGRPQPTKEVDAAWHRVRLLNGSNARIYKLVWSHDVKMVVIGGDGGLMESPLTLQVLTLAPGQRADVLLDLTALPAGTAIHLDSQGYPEADAGVVGMGGMGGARWWYAGRWYAGRQFEHAEWNPTSRDDIAHARQKRPDLSPAGASVHVRRVVVPHRGYCHATYSLIVSTHGMVYRRKDI
jgi:blue copper oxidase